MALAMIMKSSSIVPPLFKVKLIRLPIGSEGAMMPANVSHGDTVGPLHRYGHLIAFSPKGADDFICCHRYSPVGDGQIGSAGFKLVRKTLHR